MQLGRAGRGDHTPKYVASICSDKLKTKMIADGEFRKAMI